MDHVASSWSSDGEGVHVVALEGVDVAGEQRLLRGVHRRRRRRRATSCGGERRPGPLERAVHRRDGRVEQLGDLVGLPAQHLAQDQHGPLARAAGAAARRRTPGGSTRARRPRRPGRRPPARRRPSGTGSTQAALGQRRPQRRCRADRAGPRSIGRARRWRPLEHVEADVRRDPVEPRPQRGAALEPVEAAPGPHERLLHRVLGLERRAEHPVAVAGQLDPVPLEVMRPHRDGTRCQVGHEDLFSAVRTVGPLARLAHRRTRPPTSPGVTAVRAGALPVTGVRRAQPEDSWGERETSRSCCTSARSDSASSRGTSSGRYRARRRAR